MTRGRYVLAIIGVYGVVLGLQVFSPGGAEQRVG